jgi:hypothetical protein
MKHLLSLAVGFLLGGAVMCAVFALSTLMPPPTPKLRAPTAITVTLYPGQGVGGTDCEPVDIPPEKLDFAFRLLTPDQYFRGGVHDFITRIVAEAVFTHKDGTQTFVMVRDHGHNPAVVSVDGTNYFYARNDPDVHAGGVQLIRLVTEVAHTKRTARQPKR